MKYKFRIPTPSAKRLEKNRKLIIKSHSVFETKVIKEYVIPDNVENFIFDFNEPNLEIDLHYFDADCSYIRFYMVYQNLTGSRKEEVEIDPIKME